MVLLQCPLLLPLLQACPDRRPRGAASAPCHLAATLPAAATGQGAPCRWVWPFEPPCLPSCHQAFGSVEAELNQGPLPFQGMHTMPRGRGDHASPPAHAPKPQRSPGAGAACAGGIVGRCYRSFLAKLRRHFQGGQGWQCKREGGAPPPPALDRGRIGEAVPATSPFGATLSGAGQRWAPRARDGGRKMCTQRRSGSRPGNTHARGSSALSLSRRGRRPARRRRGARCAAPRRAQKTAREERGPRRASASARRPPRGPGRAGRAGTA
jgi:hypothetical protein